MICHHCRREVDLFATRCPHCHLNPFPAHNDGGPINVLIVICLIAGLTCLSLAPFWGWLLLASAVLLFLYAFIPRK